LPSYGGWGGGIFSKRWSESLKMDD
jgi:hypothetical protein